MSDSAPLRVRPILRQMIQVILRLLFKNNLGGGGINTPRTYVGVPVQALTPITPTHPPAQVFEGIVDLDPRVTVIPV